MSHSPKPLAPQAFAPAGTPPAQTISEALSEQLHLRLKGFGSVEWTDSTPSTNQDLTQRARQADPSHPPFPWLRGAREQTAGKGRAGRPWQNTSDDTLMFSCAFAPGIPLAHLPGLAPALGVAACEALRQLIAHQVSRQHSLHLGLKWPNDLQWSQPNGPGKSWAKLAGILVETAPCSGHTHPVVVAGIGLNLRGAKFLSDHLGRPIADWSEIIQISSSEIQTASQIVAAVAQAWQQAIQTYTHDGYAAFQKRYMQVDDLLGIPVDLIDQGNVLLSGRASGTDETGRLLIQTASGLVPVMTGDVSVRPSITLKQNDLAVTEQNTTNPPLRTP